MLRSERRLDLEGGGRIEAEVSSLGLACGGFEEGRGKDGEGRLTPFC